VAPALQGQQSLSSPVTIGGVNCGELRLQEAYATGGNQVATIKTCQNGFGLLETSFTSPSGSTNAVFSDGGNLFYGSQIWRPLGSSNNAMVLTSTGGNSHLYMFNQSGLDAISLNTQSGGHGTLTLRDVNGQGEARLLTGPTDGATLELDGANSAITGVRIEGGAFGVAGRIRSYDVAGDISTELGSGALLLYEPTSGVARIRANSFGYVDMFAISGPANPATDFGRVYVRASDYSICVRTPSGADNCPLSTGYVDLTSAQTINGAKYFTQLRSSDLSVRSSATSANLVWLYPAGAGDGSVDIWPSNTSPFATINLRGNFGGSGAGGIQFFNPSTGNATMTLRGGGGSQSITVNSSSGAARAVLQAAGTDSGTGNFYDSGNVERVRINAHGTNGVRLFDGSGNQRLNIETISGGAQLTSPGSVMSLGITGDSLGSSTMTLRNTTGTNGVLIATGGSAGDLAEFQLQSTSRLTARMEGRTSARQCGLGVAELQFGYTDTVGATDFGLIAARNGACIPKSYPLRFMASGGGYVGLAAPSFVGFQYTMILPPALGSVGQNLCIASGAALGWCTPPSGGGSYVDTTTNQNISGTKFTTGGWRATELAVRSTSGSSNVWQAYVSAGIPYNDFTNSFGQATLSLTGQTLAADVAAIKFWHPTTFVQTMELQGGSNTSIPLIHLNNSSADQRVSLTVQSTGGRIDLYDNFNNNVLVFRGGTSGFGLQVQAWNGSGLSVALTTTVSISCPSGTGTLTFSSGWLTGKSGSC